MLIRSIIVVCLILGLCRSAGAVTFATTPFINVQNRPDARSIIIDHYVSNPQPGGVAIDNGNVLVAPNPFNGFIFPSNTLTTRNPLPTAVGIQIQSSAGSVTFIDGTFTISSDIIAGRNAGDTLALRFVDPANPSRPAAISAFAGVVGSTLFTNFLQARDVFGNIIPTNSGNPLFLPQSATGNAQFGVETRDAQSNLVSEIHELIFTTNQTDLWLLGSFSGVTTSIDMVISGFTTDVPQPNPIPSPSALSMTFFSLALAWCRRRR